MPQLSGNDPILGLNITFRGISLQRNWKIESQITQSQKYEMNKDHRIWIKCDDL
jgi:hypothetical protein